MNPYYVGLVVPVVFTLLIRSNKPRKRRGVPVDVGGENGYPIRNSRYPSLVESASEEISTLAELVEWSCKLNQNKPFLGTRKLIAKENKLTQDGRSLEKLHLGEYEWLSYGQVFQDICYFASGLIKLGHSRNERVAIFADTREEWFIALQGCFRRNITVVTIYASLGEEVLCHSLNETEVTTLICGNKEMEKLVDVSGQLDTVKRIICMDDELSPNVSLIEEKVTVSSFPNVKRLGRKNFVDADMLLSADTAVIMYTSGNTGLPKGVMMTHGYHWLIFLNWPQRMQWLLLGVE